MGRPCKWCGVFIQDDDYLGTHEQSHRELDVLAGIGQTQPDTMRQEDREKDMTELKTNDSETFSCDTCHKQFALKSSLQRHQRVNHGTQQFSCSKCEKKFSREDSKCRHEISCDGQRDHVCPQCQKRCVTSYGLKRHLQWHEKAPKKRAPKPATVTKSNSTVPTTEPLRMPEPPSPQFRCRRCTELFNNRRDLYLHGMERHYQQVGGALQSHPWGRNELPPWDGDDALHRVFEANAAHILENHRRGPIQSVYNFPLTNDVTLNQLMQYADDIYRQQQRAFRLNLVFGVILQHRETGQYRYFVPYNNNGIFERPLYISRRTDLQRLRLQLERKDIMTELLRQRPDTKWIPVLITKIHFVVYSTFYPLGQGQLPDFLLKKDSLYPLVKSRHTGKPYK